MKSANTRRVYLKWSDNLPQPTKIYKAAALEAIFGLEKNISKKGFSKKEAELILNQIAKKHNLKGQLPRWYLNYILLTEKNLFKQIKGSSLEKIAILLKTHDRRTQSGVAPVSLFTAPGGCPFNCLYCPKGKDTPKSYLKDEPAIMRAIRNDYDPIKQTLSRLIQLKLLGHSVSKIDIIIQGGTFSFYDKKYRKDFIAKIFLAANTDLLLVLKRGYLDIPKKIDLNKIQKSNEKADNRIIGITVETRPDFINVEELKFLRELGVTRIEIGVQSLDEQILKTIKRGHGLLEIQNANKLLRDFGFKVNFHMMPNLPGATPRSDISTFKELFKNPAYRPDYLKIYPTMVVKGSDLAKWYKANRYISYSNKTLLSTLYSIYKVLPNYVRVQRLIRDIPAGEIVSGSTISNLHEDLDRLFLKNKTPIVEIRSREIAGDIPAKKLIFKKTTYECAGGKEYFLEYIDKENRLYGLLRLRICEDNLNAYKNFKGKTALVREIHVYGEATKLKSLGPIQHKGLGSSLLKEAEKIAKLESCSSLAIIAGIGVRKYYYEKGYRLVQTYMYKKLI
ncbi:MAG: elongator complex protein 3 [Minisyncoccia bacterium]